MRRNLLFFLLLTEQGRAIKARRRGIVSFTTDDTATTVVCGSGEYQFLQTK